MAVAAVVLAGGLVAACGSDGGRSTMASSDSVPGSSGSAASNDSVASDAKPAVVPQGFATTAVRVTKTDGTVCELCLWSAESPEQHRQGLMGVTSFGGYDGMFFRFDAPRRSGFWMKNTVMPLSIAWIALDGSVVTMSDMDPCPPDTECPTYRPTGEYVWAIEVEQGRLAEFGFSQDSVVTLLNAPCERSSSAAP
jgi:uncharacterized membrane protein (UPF0127 family)